MLRMAIVYGGLAGTATILAMITGFELGDGTGAATSQAVGYLIMLASFSFIFFGIKRFRDVEQGGVIKFSKALALGTMMAAVAGVFYVVIWEVYLAATDFAFVDQYVSGAIEAKQAEGLASGELQSEIEKLEQFKTTYRNPLLRVPITFAEIFPIGFIVALVSSALLRRTDVLPAKG